MAFIDCTGLEQRASLSPGSTAGTSYQNDAEAQLVAHAVQQLLTGPHAMQPSDIGVITPYSGQVNLALPSSPPLLLSSSPLSSSPLTSRHPPPLSPLSSPQSFPCPVSPLPIALPSPSRLPPLLSPPPAPLSAQSTLQLVRVSQPNLKTQSSL